MVMPLTVKPPQEYNKLIGIEMLLKVAALLKAEDKLTHIRYSDRHSLQFPTKIL
jgi:hypothetical protein